MYNQKMWREMEELVKKFGSITITGGKEADTGPESSMTAAMEGTQNQRVVRPKRGNTETKQSTETDGHGRDTGDFAGTLRHQGKSSLKPKEDRGTHDLMEENTALKAQLENSRVQQNLFYCKWAAAMRKIRYLTTELEEVSNKHRYRAAGAEATIQELKGKLERSRNSDARSYEAEIRRLKSELSEARVESINAVNRLILSDRITASLNRKLDEANRGLEQQQKDNAEAVAALKRAEEEKAKLEQILRRRHEQWTQVETATVTELDELDPGATKVCEERTRRGWLGSLFT